MKRVQNTVMIMLTLLCVATGRSWGGPVTEDMTFKGTLIAPPPCTISNGNMIDVDFGDKVGISKVDGVNYMQPISYTVDCSAGSTPWSMTLTLKGTVTSFDTAAVQTDNPKLGIQIQQNSQRFLLNNPIPVDPAHPPVLQAVPVKEPGSTLSTGTFNATATLLAVYQ